MYSYNPYYEKYLAHYGVKHKSGRYPWGSGDRPYQGDNFFTKKRSNAKIGKFRLVNDGSSIAKDVVSGAKKGLKLASKVGTAGVAILGGLEVSFAAKQISNTLIRAGITNKAELTSFLSDFAGHFCNTHKTTIASIANVMYKNNPEFKKTVNKEASRAISDVSQATSTAINNGVNQLLNGVLGSSVKPKPSLPQHV